MEDIRTYEETGRYRDQEEPKRRPSEDDRDREWSAAPDDEVPFDIPRD